MITDVLDVSFYAKKKLETSHGHAMSDRRVLQLLNVLSDLAKHNFRDVRKVFGMRNA
jgi:hypothetical protein